MARFVIGDELGNIKLLKYKPDLSEAQLPELTFHHAHQSDYPPRSVQKIAVKHSGQPNLITASFSDGDCCLSQLTENDSMTVLATWKEDQFKGSRFVGMANDDSITFTCTSAGMLRRTSLIKDEGNDLKDFHIHEQTHANLPSRLCDWRLSEDGLNFAYGGDEVDASLWNTERAFQTGLSCPTVSQPSLKRRKKSQDLYLGEVWRARNLPNDHLGLRPPVRITTLTFLQSSVAGCHLITGTQFGDLRKYDTRAGRRPVSNWTSLGNVGGVKVLEKGYSEHQLFIADGGSSLSSLDLRTGSILHRYKGISGAVTSIAPSPKVMLSVSLDRFARACSTHPPPQKAGKNQEHKPEVLEKYYLSTTPTVVVWDQNALDNGQKHTEDDEIWDKLKNILQ